MQRGAVVETGTHAQLQGRPGGAYATLVKLQQQRHAQAGEEDQVSSYMPPSARRTSPSPLNKLRESAHMRQILYFPLRLYPRHYSFRCQNCSRADPEQHLEAHTC